VTSNDASKLTAGKAQYSCLPNEQGGIVDDLIVYCLQEGAEYMLVVNASNIEKDWEWISRHNTEGVEMENISDTTALLAVQGPKAISYVQQLTDTDLTNLKYYTFVKTKFAGIDDVIISATGYTGSGGVEIYFANEGNNAQTIWEELFRIGSPAGMKPIGLAARDTLRLEMGYCLYGNDIDDTTSPLEAGLGWITKFTKEFTAKAILEAQKEAGIERKLVGLEMIDKGIPRHHYKVQNEAGEEIGYITSGTQAPSLGKAIGIAYVRKDLANEGSEVYVVVRDKALKAKVVKMPFA
jgi:aminomethyltransferase